MSVSALCNPVVPAYSAQFAVGDSSNVYIYIILYIAAVSVGRVPKAKLNTGWCIIMIYGKMKCSYTWIRFETGSQQIHKIWKVGRSTSSGNPGKNGQLDPVIWWLPSVWLFKIAQICIYKMWAVVSTLVTRSPTNSWMTVPNWIFTMPHMIVGLVSFNGGCTAEQGW